MKNETVVSLLLRIGIAFSFLYAAIQSFRDPISWIGYFPPWVLDLTSPFIEVEVLLSMFSAAEIIVALWILSGWRGLWSGLFAAGMLLGIVVTNVGALDILFRDVSIIFASVAYAVHSNRRN